MRNQLTNISCLMGLFIIFVMAACNTGNYLWIAGIFALLFIAGIRSLLGEISQKTDRLLAILSWICVALTLMLAAGKPS
jgi:uncharacterized membrane protein